MKTVVRWTIRLFLLLILLFGVMLLFGQNRGNRIISKTYDVPEPEPAMDAAPDSTQLAHGFRLSHTLACRACHSADLSGTVLVDAPPFKITSPNLTGGQGSPVATYTDADWVRSIKYGVRPNRTAIALMPAPALHALSPSDLGDLVGYLKSVQPVDTSQGETQFRLIGKIILATGAPLFETTKLDVNKTYDYPAPATSAEYGSYLYRITCVTCHGADLTGGPFPGDPKVTIPSLVGSSEWTADQFARALRTGETPGVRQLDDLLMPWSAYKHFTDDETQALYAYIQSAF